MSGAITGFVTLQTSIRDLRVSTLPPRLLTWRAINGFGAIRYEETANAPDALRQRRGRLIPSVHAAGAVRVDMRLQVGQRDDLAELPEPGDGPVAHPHHTDPAPGCHG